MDGTDYRLDLRVTPSARYTVTFDEDHQGAYLRYLAREARDHGTSQADLVMLGSLDEVPAYVRPIYPQFRAWRGLTSVQVDLAPVGFPGFRTITRFVYHRAGDRLIAYYVPEDLPPDEAVTRRVMSDIITGAVAEMHVHHGRLFTRGMPPLDRAEYDAARASQALIFSLR
jgi:hypothetical protein